MSIRVKDFTVYPDGSGIVGLFQCEGHTWVGNYSAPSQGVKVAAVSDAGWLKRGLRQGCVRRVEAFMRGQLEAQSQGWHEENAAMYADVPRR